MNPFSAFLVPRNNQAIDMSPVSDALNQMRGRSQDRQHVLENSQRQSLAEKDDARSNAYLQLQQAQQQRKFSTEDQKQVEDLLAEYHDALDTGDAERVNRATAMLKRFGMDVQSGTAPGSTPDLKAFTGQSLLPNVQQKPDLQALTGQPPNPIDDAVQTELKSREALKAKNSAPEQDLSQDDFEQQLINGDQTPSRYEEGGKTTPEFKAMLPQDEPEDLGDVDDPKFKAAADAEAKGGKPQEVIDLDAEDATPLQIGQQPQAPQSPPRLPGQLLPTIISKGGKVLEQSNGAAGRYAPMVGGVFEPFISHQNPDVAQAGQRAQAIAQKLITVDGVAPKDAIKLGMEYLNNETNRIAQLERTKIGSRAHVAGAAAGSGTPFNIKDRRFYTGEMHETVQKFKNENIETGIRGYDAALAALNSNNPASQNDALLQLVSTRSGKTVSDRERALYENIAGLMNGIAKKVNMAAGQPMPEEYRGQFRSLLQEAKNAVVQAREERAKAAENYHRRKLMGAPQDVVENDAKGVGEAIRMGGGESPEPGDTSEEDLY